MSLWNDALKHHLIDQTCVYCVAFTSINMESKQQAEWVMEQSLGKGAFGVVTLWKHRESAAKIAIKTFKDTNNENWYKREKEMMEQLNHRNLVNTVPIPAQFHRHASRILCMEYCSEGNLRKILSRPENCCGIPELTIRKCLKDVKDALEYLHLSQRISHRDLKPENIVLQKTQDEEIFKLIDLGFGKPCDSTQTSMVGTNGYVAPEVFEEDFLLEGYSSSVDYWSLGVICHEMVTGYLPFLPHMRKSPVKWMGKVRFKTDEVITVYENVYGRNDDIVFSEHLSSENHLTEAFARKLEVWLRLALRWDYRKRGRDRKSQLIIFSSLDDILDKKIVTLFSAVTYAFLSYEIDDSTTALDIKHSILRDTQQPIENQLLLLPTGETVTDELKLAKHWDPTLVAMLYVFSKEGISLPLEPAPPPPTLTSVLEEHKEPLPYHKRKRACSSAIHFLQTQLSVCEAFYEALAAVVLSVMNGMKDLSYQDYLVRDEIVNCAARLDVLKESILYNEKRYKREQKCGAVRVGENFLDEAKTKMKSFLSAAKHLKEQQNSSSLQEIQIKLSEASAFESTDSMIKDLKSSLEKGYHIIKNLLVMPKELQESEENCSEIVEVVLNFLEIMDYFINDGRIRETVEKAKDCKNMMNNLIPKFKNLSIDVKNVNRDILLAELGLFKAVWDLLLLPKDCPTQHHVASLSNTLVDENLLLHRQFEESFARQRDEFSEIRKRYETLTKESQGMT